MRSAPVAPVVHGLYLRADEQSIRVGLTTSDWRKS